jgi:predicted phosphate transport protein (TIGR00153 family)
MKEKKNELIEVSEKYQAELLKCVESLHESVNTLIEKKIDQTKLDEVIACEHECDVLKEKYIEVIYKQKRALPFLIEDRYKIINSLDHIADKSEGLARHMKIFPFEIFQDIKEEMHHLNNISLETVKTLIEIVKLMETDFSTAFTKTFKSEELKREARESKYTILETLYKKKDDALKVIITEDIVSKMFDIVAIAEDFSDYLRGLIIKYPSK